MQTEDERKKLRIEELLEKHNLCVEWQETFCKYIFKVKNVQGEIVWTKQTHNLKKMRDLLLDFLENYGGE